MRLIDVEALIDDCKKYLNKLNPSRDGKECTRIHWLIGILSSAPTIELEQKWIPCKDGGEPKSNDICWVTTFNGEVIKASYAPKANDQPNGFIRTEEGFGFYEYGKGAVAWMPYSPYPKPYREEGGK